MDKLICPCLRTGKILDEARANEFARGTRAGYSAESTHQIRITGAPRTAFGGILRENALRHYCVENLWMVRLVNFLPGSTTVEGNSGLFGESG